MKYSFGAWMFVNGTSSSCFTPGSNDVLSEKDIEGVKTYYPRNEEAVSLLIKEREQAISQLFEATKPSEPGKKVLQQQLESVRSR
jgi:hypothetical protein